MMGKFKTMSIAALLGAAGMYAALQYHIVRANEGYLMVHRAPQPRLQDVYADVRGWNAKTWAARPAVAQALSEGGRADLIVDEAGRAAADDPDDLSEPLDPEQTLPASAARRWEPIAVSRAPDVSRAPEGIRGTQPRSGKETSAWAKLFGWITPEGGWAERSASAAEEDPITPVLPAAQARRPIVEILPSPDDVDLGRQAPLPSGRPGGQPRSGWQPIHPGARYPQQPPPYHTRSF